MTLLKYLALLIGGFLASISLLDSYLLGDQLSYHSFYSDIYGASFFDVFLIARAQLNASEPLTIVLLWLGSNLGIEKNIFIAFLNILLIGGLYALFRKHKAPPFVFALILSNFYLLVLMTGAERLKIAYILLVYAFLCEGRARISLLLLTPFAHLSSFILLLSIFAGEAARHLKHLFSTLRIRRTTLILLIVTGLIFMALALVLSGGIISKLGYINRDRSFGDIVVFGGLLLAGLLATADKLRFSLALIPIGLSTIAFGDSRVNMIGLTLFIGLLLFERRLARIPSLLILSYSSLKSIPFVLNIYEHGNGFGGPLW